MHKRNDKWCKKIYRGNNIDDVNRIYKRNDRYDVKNIKKKWYLMLIEYKKI